MKYYSGFNDLFGSFYKVYGENEVEFYHDSEYKMLDTPEFKYAKDLGKSEAKLMGLIAEKKRKERDGKSLTMQQKEELDEQLKRVNKLRKKYHTVPWNEHDEVYI